MSRLAEAFADEALCLASAGLYYLSAHQGSIREYLGEDPE